MEVAMMPEIPSEAARQLRSERTLVANDLCQLRAQRQLGRRYLPFLKTLSDFDIACEVGYHELSGTPLTVKHLMLLDIAPAVTVFRRLERLCAFGVVLRTRSPRDGRVHELRLSPAVHRLFAMYVRLNEHPAEEVVRARPEEPPSIRGGELVSGPGSRKDLRVPPARSRDVGHGEARDIRTGRKG